MVTATLASFLLLVYFERVDSCAPAPAPSPPNPPSIPAPPATGPVKNVS